MSEHFQSVKGFLIVSVIIQVCKNFKTCSTFQQFQNFFVNATFEIFQNFTASDTHAQLRPPFSSVEDEKLETSQQCHLFLDRVTCLESSL